MSTQVDVKPGIDPRESPAGRAAQNSLGKNGAVAVARWAGLYAQPAWTMSRQIYKTVKSLCLTASFLLFMLNPAHALFSPVAKAADDLVFLPLFVKHKFDLDFAVVHRDEIGRT